MAIGQTGWSADGGLLAIAGTGGGRALYFLPEGKRGTAQPLYPDVASFTLGPDRPLPLTLRSRTPRLPERRAGPGTVTVPSVRVLRVID